MKKTIQLITSLFCFALGASSVHAQDASSLWATTTGGTLSWADSANWTGGIIATGVNQLANCDLNIGGNTTVTLPHDITIGTAQFGDSSGNSLWTLNGPGKLIVAGSPAKIRAVRGGVQIVTVNCVVDGTVGLRTPDQAGTVLFNTNNLYTGDTEIYRGTVRIGHTNALPGKSVDGRSGNINFINLGQGNGTLDLRANSITINGLASTSGGLGTVQNTVAGTATFTVGDDNASGDFAGTIVVGTGDIALTKIGTGTQTLSGASTYEGATTVNAGTLLVNGSIGGGANVSAVTVNGGTFGGSGTCFGPVTVAATGNISAGASAGTLTLWGSLDMSAPGTTNIWELAADSDSNPGTDFDVINIVSGSATLDLGAPDEATLRIRFIGSATTPNGLGFWASPHTWNIITTVGGSGTTKFKTIVVDGPPVAGTFTNSNDGNNIVLHFTPGAAPFVAPRPNITSITGAGTASVTVNYTNTVPTKTYFVRYATNINGNWTTNLPGKVAVGTSDFQVDSPVSGPRRYYQVYYVSP